MTLKELQLLSEALWEAAKVDLVFFSPIKLFLKNLAEFDYTDLNKDSLNEVTLYANKIDEFFERYRSHGESLYIPPSQTSRNDDTVRSITKLINILNTKSDVELSTLSEEIKPSRKETSIGDGLIFIGHGRSQLWARLQLFLQNELGLNTITFETESHTSQTIIAILEDFLKRASYAILVLTAEDETVDGKMRARQNVVHEAGLFQGRLGFDKVIILKQTAIEEFSNIAGLQYINFNDNNIEQTFYELQRTLKKSGMLK